MKRCGLGLGLTLGHGDSFCKKKNNNNNNNNKKLTTELGSVLHSMIFKMSPSKDLYFVKHFVVVLVVVVVVVSLPEFSNFYFLFHMLELFVVIMVAC